MEMHPGCIAGEAARLHTPITFDPALVSDFTLTKDAAYSGSALSNWLNPTGSCCRRYKALERWMGNSFSSVCSHAVVTHWQERRAEKPSLAAIWQPESRELGLEVKEKIAFLFTTCKKEEEVKLGPRAGLQAWQGVQSHMRDLCSLPQEFLPEGR